MKNWFENIPEIYRNKIIEYLNLGIQKSNIYERSANRSTDRGYLDGALELCHRVDGMLTALFLAEIIEYPASVSIGNGKARFIRWDKDFVIRGTPDELHVYEVKE